MKQSNYETMSIQMRSEFKKYDQDKMIAKFNLKYDEAYLYLRFCGRNYCIDRESGAVYWSEEDIASRRAFCSENGDDFLETLGHAGYNEVMSIYDILCHSKDGCCLSGRFSSIYNMKGVVYSSGPGKFVFSKKEAKFAHKIEELKAACEMLGGTHREKGDVCYEIPVFDFLPVIFRFYDADEEFPASIQLFWDENTLDFLHFETTFFVTEHLLYMLGEQIKTQEKKK